MIHLVKLTDEIKDLADTIFKKFPKQPLKDSFMRGQGTYIGCLGQAIVMDFLGQTKDESTFGWDIRKGMFLYEVKSKGTTVQPKKEYMVSVAKQSFHQNPDYYIFCRIKVDREAETIGDSGWILGYTLREAFFKLATFLKKGEREGNNGYIVRNDCWNLPITELWDIKRLLRNPEDEPDTKIKYRGSGGSETGQGQLFKIKNGRTYQRGKNNTDIFRLRDMGHG